MSSTLNSIANFSLSRTTMMGIQSIKPESKIGKMGKYLIGFMVTAVTAAVDAVFHAFLAALSVVTGLIVTPYNLIAGAINRKYQLPEELEFGMAFEHLAMIMEAAMMPLANLSELFKGDH